MLDDAITRFAMVTVNKFLNPIEAKRQNAKTQTEMAAKTINRWVEYKETDKVWHVLSTNTIPVLPSFTHLRLLVSKKSNYLAFTN
jgi:hypothetical protein